MINGQYTMSNSYIAICTLQNRPFHRDFLSNSTCFFTQRGGVENQTPRAALGISACGDGKRSVWRWQTQRAAMAIMARCNAKFSVFRRLFQYFKK